MNAQTASARPVPGQPGRIELLASNRYYDKHYGCEAIKVLPGEYYVTPGELLLVTALGSCVAACIRDRRSGIGGMNHFMLADDPQVPASRAAGYGIQVMDVLLKEMLKQGARRANLEVKIFGGGNTSMQRPDSGAGQRNCRFLLDYLRAERLPVVASDLLHNYPRKVYFFPASGRVLVKKMLRQHNDTLFRRESSYAARLSGNPPGAAGHWFEQTT